MITATNSLPTGQIALQKYFLALSLKEAREKQGLDQQALAEKSGVSQSGVSRLEGGRNVKIDDYLAVVKALQLDHQELWATVQNKILALEKQAEPDVPKEVDKPHDPAFSILQARLMLEQVGISKDMSDKDALLELTKRLFAVK